MNYILLGTCFILFFFSIFVLILGIVACYFLISSNFFRTAPPVPSSGSALKGMIKYISDELENTTGKTIIDLGSGWGTFLIPLAKKFPQHLFIGIEKAAFPFFITKFRSRNIKNIQLIKKDFFNFNLKNADIVIMFLLKPLMPKITQKILTEQKKNCVVFSNRFPLTGITPFKKISYETKFQTFFIYKFK